MLPANAVVCVRLDLHPAQGEAVGGLPDQLPYNKTNVSSVLGCGHALTWAVLRLGIGLQVHLHSVHSS
jgi:hypothetical protein